jgi:hypothetical protein
VREPVCGFVGKELHGDVATELQVFNFVDHTHPTAPILLRLR